MKVVNRSAKKVGENAKKKKINLATGSVPNFYTYVEMVEKKAYELYENRGGRHGHDCEDWFYAEKLIEDELCR